MKNACFHPKNEKGDGVKKKQARKIKKNVKYWKEHEPQISVDTNWYHWDNTKMSKENEFILGIPLK